MLGRLIGRKRRSAAQQQQIDAKTVPAHVAIIMDGNGRWAKKRGLPRLEGHRAGAKAIRETIKASVRLGIRYLTIYTFSQENWKRPKDEVDGLFGLIEATLRKELAELAEEGVAIRAVGDIEGLPRSTRDAFEQAGQLTEGNERLTLGVALNYGGRGEIVAAARALAEGAVRGEIDPSDIDEAAISSRLYTEGFPDPDLIVRTGGDMRLSNFLLWQAAYSEIWVTDTLWPDFGETELRKAVGEFAGRERRYGGLGA